MMTAFDFTFQNILTLKPVTNGHGLSDTAAPTISWAKVRY